MAISALDLSSDQEFIKFFRSSVRRGFVKWTARNFLLYLGAAEVGIEKSPALFWWIIKNKRWDCISPEAEERAHQRVVRIQDCKGVKKSKAVYGGAAETEKLARHFAARCKAGTKKGTKEVQQDGLFSLHQILTSY